MRFHIPDESGRAQQRGADQARVLQDEHLPEQAQSESATGAQFSAARSHFPASASTSSGLSRSVECAPVACTMDCSARGLSRSGQGRKGLSLKGWPAW